MGFGIEPDVAQVTFSRSGDTTGGVAEIAATCPVSKAIEVRFWGQQLQRGRQRRDLQQTKYDIFAGGGGWGGAVRARSLQVSDEQNIHCLQYPGQWLGHDGSVEASGAPPPSNKVSEPGILCSLQSESPGRWAAAVHARVPGPPFDPHTWISGIGSPPRAGFLPLHHCQDDGHDLDRANTRTLRSCVRAERTTLLRCAMRVSALCRGASRTHFTQPDDSMVMIFIGLCPWHAGR